MSDTVNTITQNCNLHSTRGYIVSNLSDPLLSINIRMKLYCSTTGQYLTLNVFIDATLSHPRFFRLQHVLSGKGRLRTPTKSGLMTKFNNEDVVFLSHLLQIGRKQCTLSSQLAQGLPDFDTHPLVIENFSVAVQGKDSI